MIITKKSHLLFLIGWLSLHNLWSCAPKPNHIAKNEYGLQVVGKGKTYKLSIQADNVKRMVALERYISPLKSDFQYATIHNFTHTILYKNPAIYVRLEAAIALQKVQNELVSKGLSLKFFDAYRPYSVTKQMWKVVPDDRYAANPAKGSGHNRGAAVDVTIIDLTTGIDLPMPTAFDDFSEKAHHNYMQLDKEVLANRQLLKGIMEKYGFVALDTEWWHYYLPNAAQRFELLDLSFRQMKRLSR